VRARRTLLPGVIGALDDYLVDFSDLWGE